MTREQVEQFFVEILASGGEPLNDAVIRAAVAADETLRTELEELRVMLATMERIEAPELDDDRNVDRLTRAFEEGVQQGIEQGRRLASESRAPAWWSLWMPRLVPAALLLVVGVFAGVNWQRLPDTSPTSSPATLPATEYPATDQVAKLRKNEPRFEQREKAARQGSDVDEIKQQAGMARLGDEVSDLEQQAEMVQLRDDVDKLEQVVMVSMLNEASANQRVKGLQRAREVDTLEPQLLTAMSSTLLEDENAGVRVAAADALTRFADMPAVRRAVLQALATESDPLVQIQLIDFIMAARDAESMMVLEKLLENPELSDVARNRATEALIEMGEKK